MERKFWPPLIDMGKIKMEGTKKSEYGLSSRVHRVKGFGVPLSCFASPWPKRAVWNFFPEEFLREKAHSVKQIVHDGLLLGLPPPLTHSRQEGKQNAADRSIGRKTDRRRKGICQISENKKKKNSNQK